MSRTPGQQREAWQRILRDPLLSPEYLRDKGLACGIDDTEPRSLYWKIYLDVVPSITSEAWQLVLEKERRGYSDLKEKYIFDPSKLKEATDWSLNNPLSLAEDSPWKQYFADVDLRKVIMQDVERTFPDQERFRDEAIQTLLCNVLFVWCKMNPDISYRQGMHELLAITFIVVDQDKVDVADPAAGSDAGFKTMFDSRFVEHDTATLFFRIMRSVKPWYEVNEGQPLYMRPQDARTKMQPKTIPIVAACRRIQNELLAALDLELSRHIESHGIEPQLYGLRWLRLLFAREFTLPKLLQLWDGLFAEDASLALAEWIAVAMLTFVRREVLESDYSGTMFTLMKYPPLENVSSSEVIASARGLRDRYYARSLGTSVSGLVDSSSADASAKTGKFGPGQRIAQPVRSKRANTPWTGYDAGNTSRPAGGSSAIQASAGQAVQSGEIAAARPTSPANQQSQSQKRSQDPLSTEPARVSEALYPGSPQPSSHRSSTARPSPVAFLKHIQERDQRLAADLATVVQQLQSLKAVVQQDRSAVSEHDDHKTETAAVPGDINGTAVTDTLVGLAIALDRLADIQARLERPLMDDSGMTPATSMAALQEFAPGYRPNTSLSSDELQSSLATDPASQLPTPFSASSASASVAPKSHPLSASTVSATTAPRARVPFESFSQGLPVQSASVADGPTQLLAQGADALLGQVKAGFAGVNKAFSSLFDESATSASAPQSSLANRGTAPPSQTASLSSSATAANLQKRLAAVGSLSSSQNASTSAQRTVLGSGPLGGPLSASARVTTQAAVAPSPADLRQSYHDINMPSKTISAQLKATSVPTSVPLSASSSPTRPATAVLATHAPARSGNMQMYPPINPSSSDADPLGVGLASPGPHFEPRKSSK
ncbi:rab-GTPase-TBC domain-containing protein [Entophlyctis helioformis]|nr:rab-GTPase-TBC domain-containing protein [Entophlyctis helioformis]